MTNERIHSDGAAQRSSEADTRTELMHAVLDGTADAERMRELDALIASDAAAAQEFAAWKSMFRTLSAIPMSHPPEGLVAAISAAIPVQTPSTQNKFVDPHQLFSDTPVIASGQAQTRRPPSGFRAFFRRPSRSESSQEFGQMNASRKIWAGGAVAAVALGVAVFATGYPPKAENLTGTVAPAERYRAPQAGSDAIKLGEPAATTTAAAPAAATGIEAGKADAAKADAAKADAAKMDASKADASRMVASKTDAQMMAEKADASRAVAAQADASRMVASKTDAQMVAEKADASRAVAAKADASKMDASKADASRMMAAKTDAQLMAEKADASRAVAAKADASKADASRAEALKADAQLQAERAKASKASN
jgi:hypothetical protein